MSACIHYICYISFLFVSAAHSEFSIRLSSFDRLRTVGNHQHHSMPMMKAQNFEVAPGINYEYIHVKAKDDGNPKSTLLFLHGFPSSLHSWRHQIEHFSRQGYGCVAPNLMGYGKTYSPLNKNEYIGKSMVEHLTALLDHLKLNKVIVVAHDWGTRVASRFVLYHPERTLGVVLISGGYNAPALFDLDQAIENSKKAIGYETLGYWKFFESDDAATIIENTLDSFIDLIFANDSILIKTDFAPVGKVRDWLAKMKRTNRASFMTKKDYRILRQYLAEGMQPKLNWYKALIGNIDWNDEKNLDPVVKRPVLFMGGTKDYVSLIAAYGGQNKYIADLETVEVDAGHWVMEEVPDTVNRELDRWIKRILPVR